MKLILTAEVDHLGTAGDTVEVKDGYGRNYLLPRGLAIVASRGAERQAEDIRRARETKTVRGLDHAKELKTALEALGPVSLTVQTAGDSGKLFGSVTAGRRRRRHQEGRRTQSGQADRPAAQGAHQGGRHARDLGAAAPRGKRRGVAERRSGVVRKLTPTSATPG